MTYQHIRVPTDGERITVGADSSLNVPGRPVIPYIEGDGIGVDITPVMRRVVDAAVERAYGGTRRIAWMEVYAGEKAVRVYGKDTWLPAETLEAVRDYVVSIKGPLTTPVGGGIRSLNVALRQELDLYVCLRPIRYYPGTPSPVKHPERTDMVIFRENSEDIYAGIEKFTEGAFKNWGYELAREEFGATEIDGGPWCRLRNPRTGREILVKDVIADAFLQQILLRPEEYSVIATLNLNGDYISDALAAQVGGIGIAPGANLSDTTAMFEATHGTAPKYAGQDKVNPGSLVLSAEMMLRHLGWTAAADLIVRGMSGAIQAKAVTYDFARLMDGAREVSCSGFGEELVRHMGSA